VSAWIAAFLEIDADHGIEPIAPSGVHHLEALLSAGPTASSDENEMGELEAHPGLPCYLEHLA
jgi:hypothetical protein